MKNKLLSSLLILSALALSGCSLIMNTNTFSISSYEHADEYLVGDQTYTDEITRVKIDWYQGYVCWQEDENVTGLIIEEDTSLNKEEELVHSYFHDGVVDIKFFKSGYKINHTNFIKRLFVKCQPGLNELNINYTSGKVEFDECSAKNINLTFTSGELEIDNMVCDELDLTFTSGKVLSGYLTARKINASFTTGELDLEGVTVGDITVTGTYGKCILKFFAVETGNVSMGQGYLRFLLPDEGARLNITSESNDIELNRQYTQEGNSYIFGDGSAVINVTVTTGKVIVY